VSRVRVAARAAGAPLATARVATWTWAGVRSLRRDLRADGIDAVAAVPPAPALDDRHRATVSGLLRLMGATCLVRAAVLQRWDADHGRRREIIIGVARREGGIAAHAWLAGDRGGRFVELYRHPPAEQSR
jgi:hypothetical protein